MQNLVNNYCLQRNRTMIRLMSNILHYFWSLDEMDRMEENAEMDETAIFT